MAWMDGGRNVTKSRTFVWLIKRDCSAAMATEVKDHAPMCVCVCVCVFFWGGELVSRNYRIGSWHKVSSDHTITFPTK